MKIYKHSSNSNGDEGQVKHNPEFIYVDNRRQKREPVQVLRDEEGEFAIFEKEHYPVSLRVLTLIGSFAAFMLSLVLILAVIVSFTMALICLFKCEKLNEKQVKYWKMFQKSLVFFIGTFIATFSPPLGIGIITLYFMLKGESVDRNYWGSIIKSKLYK